MTSKSAPTSGKSAIMKPSTLRIGYRYRPNRLAKNYDAIVIGSGMGGLTTAALLGELGWKVCVLEQHYTAGGYTHSFERNGYEWDPGVHYIGDVGARTRTWRMFNFLSDGKLKWAPMADEYDRFYVGDKVYCAIAGKQAFRDNLLRSFPDEQQAIDRYMELLKSVGGAMSAFGMEKVMKPWQRALSSPFIKWKQPKDLYRNTYDVLSELTDNQDLIATLCGQWGDMGLPPKQSAFIVHAMIARHYLYGGFYPVGGSWQIANSIIPKIRKAGGEVFTYARVKEILIEGGKVTGVEMADGHRIDCDTVISSAGVTNTFHGLLPDSAVRDAGYEPQLEHVRPSFAHMGVTSASSRRRKNSASRKPTSGYTRVTITILRFKNSSRTRMRHFRWSTSRSRRRRIPTTSTGTLERRRSRSLRRRRTRGSSGGRAAPGASAARTTRR